MKNEIIDLIHQVSTEKAGIYSSLFGFEDFKTEKHINTNFAIPKDDNLEQSIILYLDYIISEILKNTEFEIDDDFSSNFIEYYNKEYENPFIQKSYDLNNIHSICDLENIMDDLIVTDTGNYLILNFIIPIYKIQ